MNSYTLSWGIFGLARESPPEKGALKVETLVVGKQVINQPAKSNSWDKPQCMILGKITKGRL